MQKICCEIMVLMFAHKHVCSMKGYSLKIFHELMRECKLPRGGGDVNKILDRFVLPKVSKIESLELIFLG